MDESGKKTPLLELLRRHGKESSSEAVDLIEAQAARITELEDNEVYQTESLRIILKEATGEVLTGSTGAVTGKVLDEFARIRARIAELETERKDNIVRLKWLTIERDRWELEARKFEQAVIIADPDGRPTA